MLVSAGTPLEPKTEYFQRSGWSILTHYFKKFCEKCLQNNEGLSVILPPSNTPLLVRGIPPRQGRVESNPKFKALRLNRSLSYTIKVKFYNI